MKRGFRLQMTVTKSMSDIKHIVRKEEARVSKAQDKKRTDEGQCHAFTMDVQAVQIVPYLQASTLYFKQKCTILRCTI